MFTRSNKNPIIEANPKFPWRLRKVYNPTVIYEDQVFHLFFRAVGEDWISKIGYAASRDGENFVCEPNPILEPAEDYERKGMEDPRLTKAGDTYYLTYTAYDGDCARLALATSTDLRTWQRHGIIFPDWESGKAKSFTVSWDAAQIKSLKKNEWVKAGAIFPEKINGKFWMLFGDRNIWIANSKDGINWKPEFEPFIEPRKGYYFDSIYVEMGPPPIQTKKGWLCIYHGIDKNRTYRLGYFLLDLNDPQEIIKRCENFLLEPEVTYELNGIVDIFSGGFEALSKLDKQELDRLIKREKNNYEMPKVIFCCGANLNDDKLRIFYGGADTVICTATAELEDILEIK